MEPWWGRVAAKRLVPSERLRGIRPVSKKHSLAETVPAEPSAACDHPAASDEWGYVGVIL